MFDVGFSELVVIALVALIVIGPERLPKVARTAGILLGRLQRYVSDVKADISREMQLDEIKRVQAQMEEQARSIQDSVTHELREAESALNQTIAQPVASAATEAQGALAAPDAAPAARAIPASATEPAPAQPTEGAAGGSAVSSATAPDSQAKV